MKDKTLIDAVRLARRGKYGDAIRLLEGEIPRYRESFRFYAILALACLRSGDFGSAWLYFKSAHDLNNRDVNVLLGIAALNIRRGESARAVDLYLKALDIDPRQKTAKRALAVLRTYGGSEELAEWSASKRITTLYPPFPKVPFNLKRALIFFVPVILAAAAALGGIYLRSRVQRGLPLVGAGEARRGFEELALDGSGAVVDASGVFSTVLTGGDVLSTYDAARGYFAAYRDNKARREINKLLASNAAARVKTNARTMLRYLDETMPDFTNFKDNFSFREVAEQSALYAGCAVIWGGRAVNVAIEEDETRFELLAGYEKLQKLEGRVRVRCPFAIALDIERPLEVLGRVVPESAGGFSLEAISVHQAQ